MTFDDFKKAVMETGFHIDRDASDGATKMTTVTHKISRVDATGMGISSSIPFLVLVRLELNKHGFKFEDDNSVGCIANLSPSPIGVLKWWDDVNGDRWFEQTYEEN